MVAVVTAGAVLLLVLFSVYLFRENRTRVERHPRDGRGPAPVHTEPDGVEWRTLVDPTAADVLSARPYAVAYARAITEGVPDPEPGRTAA